VKTEEAQKYETEHPPAESGIKIVI